MIIFGWRQTVRRLATLMMQCRSCGMQSWHQVYRAIEWFTLFFVPVVPLWVSWRALCTTCGVKHKLRKADADAMVAHAQAHYPPAHT